MFLPELALMVLRPDGTRMRVIMSDAHEVEIEESPQGLLLSFETAAFLPRVGDTLSHQAAIECGRRYEAFLLGKKLTLPTRGMKEFIPIVAFRIRRVFVHVPVVATPLWDYYRTKP